MKRRAIAEPDRSLKQVYTAVLSETMSKLATTHDAEEVASAIANFNASRSAICRARAKVRQPPVTELKDLVLEGTWTKTISDEEFLLINDGSEKRILGFCTQESLEIVCESPSVFMDGTFRVVPELFRQLYTVHCFYKGQMMPSVYFLLPDGTSDTYCRMFTSLKNAAESRGLIFRPVHFQLDFEVAAIKAIEEMFPAAVVKGCQFHFTQAIWRKAQNCGLKSYYADAPVKR